MIKNLLIVSYEEFSSYIGINTRIKGMIEVLRQKGVHVEVVVPTYSKTSRYTVDSPEATKINQVFIPNLFGKLTIKIISRIIFVVIFNFAVLKYFKSRKNKYDFIQSEQIYPFWSCYILAKKFKAKVILDEPVILKYHIEDKLKRFKLINSIIKKAIYKLESIVYKSADYIFCSSQNIINYVNEKTMGNSNKLYYLPNGVNIKKYSIKNKNKNEGKIFFNCSLPYYQNVAALRNVSKIIEYYGTKSFYNYSLTIVVNDISLFPKDLLNRLKTNQNVNILSAVNSLVPYIQEADIFILPYENGHFSMAGSRLKALEALSCGKVVLSTPEGIDGLIGCVDGENIIICSDFMDMGIKIMRIIENKDKINNEMINKIQNGARCLIEKYYDWNKLIHIYDKIGK